MAGGCVGVIAMLTERLDQAVVTAWVAWASAAAVATGR